MSKRVVGFVISHSGKPGGPWEADGDVGSATVEPKRRFVYANRENAESDVVAFRAIHPAARILRLVRRERHRAEEAAVVEAAMADFLAEAPSKMFEAGAALREACAALRAKRGG